MNEKFKLANKFININSPIISYILGLLWADGYINNKEGQRQVKLTTTFPDAEYFIELFNKTGEWSKYFHIYKNNPSWRKRCDISTHNELLCNFLQSKDYLIKTNASADKILEVIPDNLKHYWFLGLLDGDGCIVVDKKYKCYSIIFCSSYEQNWNYLEKLLNQLNIKFSIHKQLTQKGNSSKVKISNRKDCIKLLDYFYENYEKDNIGLKRKHLKYLELKQLETDNQFIGVCSVYESDKWRAYTKGNEENKPIHLGHFNTKEEAIKAVQDYYTCH